MNFALYGSGTPAKAAKDGHPAQPEHPRIDGLSLRNAYNTDLDTAGTKQLSKHAIFVIGYATDPSEPHRTFLLVKVSGASLWSVEREFVGPRREAELGAKTIDRKAIDRKAIGRQLLIDRLFFNKTN